MVIGSEGDATTKGAQAMAEAFRPLATAAGIEMPAEAAMLAGLFKAPSKYAPHINLPAARARASTPVMSSTRRRKPVSRARSIPVLMP